MIPQIKGHPPNIDAIVEVFPLAAKPGVIFAYGDRIYVPSGNILPPELVAHETVHCRRQQQRGVEIWWHAYLLDPIFRYKEELLAHAAELQCLIAQDPSGKRRHLLHIAKKLAAPLYRMGATRDQARKDLKELMKAYEAAHTDRLPEA